MTSTRDLALCACLAACSPPIDVTSADESTSPETTASTTSTTTSTGEPTSSGDDTAGPSSSDSGSTGIDPDLPRVVLNEVLSKSATDGPYANLGDAIEIYNAGGAEADLSGWKLSDDPAFSLAKTYVFPVGSTLMPGEWRVLVELDAMLGEGELPFGISSDTTETLTLADGLDVVVDQVVVQGADAVVSYCRLPDGTGDFNNCDQTLGAANQGASSDCGDAVAEAGEQCDGDDLMMQTCEGLGVGFTGGTLACSPTCKFDASMCTTDNVVLLNELESTDDRIEIYNAGDAPVDISGWILTDDAVDPDYDPMNDLEKLAFADATILAPKEFLVVAKGNLPGQHPFGLSSEGDTVTLLEPGLTVVDQVSYGINQAVVSYCRLPDGPGGAWTTGCMPTFGAANEGP